MRRLALEVPDLRIYLDTSVCNRPFDDQTQPRIYLESVALATILQMVEAGTVELVSSSVLDYENSRNPFPLRRLWVGKICALAKHHQAVDEGIRDRARALEAAGLKPMDALHVACAETASCDYFLTGDDRVLKRSSSFAVAALNPVDYVLTMTGGQDGGSDSTGTDGGK